MFNKTSKLGLLILMCASVFIMGCDPEEEVVDPPETETATIIDENIDVLTTLEDKFSDPNVADYCITKTNWRINEGLIIEPGVVIEFGAGVEAKVFYDNGYITAIGTAAEPIKFTGKTKTAGFWKGILFNSDDTRNELTYCVVEYGGGDELVYAVPHTNIGVVDYAGVVGKLTLKNTIIQHSAGVGFAMNNGAKLLGFENNTFSNNANAAVQMPPNEVNMLDNGTNYVDGNGYNGVEVLDENLEQPTEQTWVNLSGTGKYKLLGDFLIRSGLVLSPNTTIEVSAATLIHVRYDGGYLTAVGTASQPITIEGEVKVAGSWKGLLFNSADVRNEMDYCVVAHGGGGEMVYVTEDANIGVVDYAGEAGRLRMTNSTIRNSAGCGISKNDGATLTQSGNTFTDITLGDVCQ